MTRLLPLLMLTGCTTMQPYASCDTARIAARLAMVAVARICPITITAEN